MCGGGKASDDHDARHEAYDKQFEMQKAAIDSQMQHANLMQQQLKRTACSEPAA